MRHAERLSDDTLVAVRRHPLNYQTAMYRFGDVTGLHWSTASGGVGTATSHVTLFGYVWCNAMASGELAHSCSHGPPPHHIKVCFVKKLNQPMWRQILHRAPARPSNTEGQSMSKDQDHSARAGVVALARGAQRTMTTTVSRQLFSGRIKTALADKLIDAGIDAPERLLFMSEQEIGAIRGVGKAGLAEIQKYRERFVPTG